ncbi:ABC transporter ATP-binding protein [Oricola thermophila]|uniref:ABC transporter ATP-binding protein n=1 Tax=Oricola thermophila TaxID=2742145 RepID=A0A6N1VFL1_9HYPH|nr:ABC transporter ATP-binding protein [Oricola thermophila]QKV19701.1 ABC transporter ATP-binding protein [Oricola thermophila]
MTCARPEPDAAAEWREVAVRYPYRAADAVGPVSLRLHRGERVLLMGPTGSGKSTLLNALTGIVPGIVPARVVGDVRLDGEPVSARPPSGWSDRVARLFQDPEQTLCGMRVGDEIAFALENRALPEDEIRRRVAAAMHRAGLAEDMLSRRTAALSGGERQLVALAAAIAQDAPLFIADEPTAHLAPAAAERFRALLREDRRERTFVVVDHRIDELVEDIDRVVVVGRDGRVAADGPPGPLFRSRRADLEALGVALPVAAALDARLAGAGLAPESPPLTVGQALAGIPPGRESAAAPAIRAFLDGRVAAPAGAPGAPVARLEGGACAPLFGPVVLRGIDLEIRVGEAVAILGANGAGKSTLAASLAGLLRLKEGRRHGPTGGMAFQNPESQFVGGSVLEELEQAQDRALPRDERRAAALRDLSAWGLDGLAGAHPFELSQGQKRRLALATLSASGRWPLLVLDEPTAGLDAAGAAMVARAIAAFRARGRAVALVTHDTGFALAACPRAVIVGEGAILADGPAPRLLADAPLLARAGLAPPAIGPALAWREAVPC